MKSIYVVMLLIVSVLMLSACTKNSSIGCTQEAKLCSDGTSVGRNASNNCEFPACPDEKIYVSEDPQQCMLIKFMCVEGKQPFFDEKGCGCEPVNTSVPNGKLQAIDCEIDRPQACTKEYMPVCGQVQVQCITTPCPPIMQTFGNKCEACANSLTISYTQGACSNDIDVAK